MRILSILTFVLALAAVPAFALELHSARAAGQIGEKADGYVTALDGSAEAQALASDVNEKRRAHYAEISQKNGQPIDVVGKVAAGTIVSGLEKGAKYQGADGSWKTK